MKSCTLVWLTVMVAVPGIRASAQVMPLGRMPVRGHAERATCHRCDPTSGGFYGMTIWGTDCYACNQKPGLFPPCPNPCQTTLLGELVYDVKVVVEGTLSHVFGCLFVYPCGCRGVCTCAEPFCDTCVGDCHCGAVAMPTPMLPSTQPLPSESEFEGDPFTDDPEPTPNLQPVPDSAMTGTLNPQRRAAVRSVARHAGARRVSYEAAITRQHSVDAPRQEAGSAVAPDSARNGIRSVPSRYQPRHQATLRQANGKILQRAPQRQNGSQPPLRFRVVD